MANLPVQKRRVTGVVLDLVAASGGGDTVAVGAQVFVRNGDATEKTVTVVVPGQEYGVNRPDFSFVVPAGEIARLGPFGKDLADPVDGLVHLTYSAVANVEVAAISG